jgi:hypothetical protein
MNKLYAAFIAGLLLTACTTTAPLEPRPGGNPLQVDLSGQWVLRAAEAPPVETDRTIRIPPATSNRSMQPVARPTRERPRTRSSSVHVFLESGTNLKVTQTDYGLFFSFDRAIVEEFNFGENRMVNIGPIEAQRVAGWDGESFVIETMDAKGNVLIESWSLAENGKVLVRDLAITERGELAWSSQQVFDQE